jgi:predicted SAM-dependent methyltransferase
MSPKDLRVVIGAGEYNNNPGWIQTQEAELNLLKRHDWEQRFAPNSLKAILAEHVWEHLSYQPAGYLHRFLCSRCDV